MKKLHKLAIILKTRDYRQAFIRHGVAAGVEHDPLFASFKEGLKTIVDIGANRGQFALAARHHVPGARLLSFEPLQEPAEEFRIVFRNDPQVELHQVAIGPQQGSQVMHVSKADDSSSLLPISDLQIHYYPGTGERETRTVEVMQLEAVVKPGAIEQGALLKIDVQGYELEALKGCRSLLDSFNYVYVECSYVSLYTGQALAGEVTEYLNQAGFNLKEVYNLARDKAGNPIQGDFFFSRE
jgi:FkbM family methyltransferase